MRFRLWPHAGTGSKPEPDVRNAERLAVGAAEDQAWQAPRGFGVFVIDIRWGGVCRFSIHTDTDRIKRYFADFARAGMDEALAAPITG